MRALIHSLLLSMVLLLAMAFSIAHAQDLRPVTKAANSNMMVILEGESIADARIVEKEDGTILIEAGPIFSALGNSYRFDPEEGAIIVERSQDKAVMSLNVRDGIVRANGKPIGRLPDYADVDGETMLLTPNAIAVLSGAISRKDAMKGVLSFELDPRLKTSLGFELYVDGLLLRPVTPEPRSVGPILLLPLRPIAEELGHTLSFSENGNVVSVRRAQDSVLMTLDMTTGLVSVNDRPRGVTPDFTYIDPQTLLLPVGAVETLTGTHVKVVPGTDRIEVTLDARMSGAIEAGDRVDDEASKTPFTLESLQFTAGLDTITNAELYFRVNRLDGRIRYEIPDLPSTAAELEPSILALDYKMLDGVYGSIGDISADNRQLDGIGIRRVRGVSATKTTDNARWSVALGAPVSGVRQVSEDQSRSTYGGLAAGVRYADKAGWEAGLAAKTDENDDTAAVLSFISGRLGQDRDKPVNWQASADIGVFDGPVRAKNVDVRGSLSARWEAKSGVDLDMFALYTGSEFLRGQLDKEAFERAQAEAVAETQLAQDDDTAEEFVPDIRVTGQDQASYGATLLLRKSEDFGIFKSPAASVRIQQNRTGMFVGAEASQTVTSVGGSISTKIGSKGPNLTADYQTYSVEGRDSDSETGQSMNVRAFQRFKAVTLRGQYSYSQIDDRDSVERFDGTVSLKSYRKSLKKNAYISFSPSLVGGWADNYSYARAGLIGQFSSGEWLGPKTKMDAHLGILQSVRIDDETASVTGSYMSLGLNRRINKNLSLRAGYRDDFKGNHSFGLSISGAYDFNESRKYSAPEKDTGVLKGQVFLDKNRDGIKQDEEPGLARAVVRLHGTRYSLRSGRDGYYTIQNLNQGIYTVTVDNRSLPLGWAVSDAAQTKASVSDGRITEVLLPVVERGQIRGVIFEDLNADNELSRGDRRIEGETLTLTNLETGEEMQTRAVSFGQFAFDDLSNGEYEIKSTANESVEPVRVRLNNADGMMRVVNINHRSSGPSATKLADAVTPNTSADPPFEEEG